MSLMLSDTIFRAYDIRGFMERTWMIMLRIG